MSVAATRPIADDVFTGPPDAPCLIGSRCGACGVVSFPVQDGCPRCGTEGMARIDLARRGTLWTWTTQGFLPKHPYAGPETEADFEPFLLGYVELPGEVRVEARLLGLTRDTVRIGMELELVTFPFRTDLDGTVVLAYAFAPVDEGGAT
jgi:uncharacterized protein